jgi:hypothetical protein
LRHMPKIRFKHESGNARIAPYSAPPALSPAVIAERRARENRTDTGPLKPYWAAVHTVYPQICAMTDSELHVLNQWIAALQHCVAVVTTDRREARA